MAERHGIETVSPDDIHKQDVDVFAPCAMGGILNDTTIPELKCKGIAGLANNQLERPEHGLQLLERGIAYAPDFVVNAGGMMGASMPIFSVPDKNKSLERISGIFDTVVDILSRSQAEQVPSEVIAEEFALERIKRGARN